MTDSNITRPARHTFTLDGQTFGAEHELFLFAGPDLADPLEVCLEVGRAARDACERLGIGYVYKGSFDKANRTSVTSYRGPGLKQGLENLARIREELSVPTITDIHTPEQAEAVKDVVSMIQVPAFLCRQTDLLQAAAESGLPISVKKGQFLAPWDMKPLVGKLEAFGATELVLTDRGTSFGYNMLVSDLRGLRIMQETGYPVCYDASHSQQLPSGHGGSSGGMGEMIGPMARAAVAAGADAVFFEVHPEPPKSKVDPDTHLPLADLPSLLEALIAIKRVVAASA
ncbi:MAG: 3-deoxy-8-phosphooctulonate synthase [Planctomycetota bacterium]|jgi:2-dehydro-3-deoxyphosphooctonate aldolase (KDO 8-P synthase)